MVLAFQLIPVKINDRETKITGLSLMGCFSTIYRGLLIRHILHIVVKRKPWIIISPNQIMPADGTVPASMTPVG